MSNSYFVSVGSAGSDIMVASKDCYTVGRGLKEMLEALHSLSRYIPNGCTVDSDGFPTSLTLNKYIFSDGSYDGTYTTTVAFTAKAGPPEDFLNSLDVTQGAAIALAILCLWAYAWAIRSIANTF